MSTNENLIDIKILDRSYKIKCPPDQAHELQASAEYVDQQMRKIRQNSNITNSDRIAVVAALNICQELLQLKKQKNNYIDMMNERIIKMQDRIQSFLKQEDKVTA
jgi:cell division protein ZapA